MSRKNRDYTREVIPDPKYNDLMVARAVNVLMRDGKKSVCEKALYDAFDIVKTKTSGDPLELFHSAIDNIRPMVEVKSRRVGGATYQVPTEVRPRRADALALRWLKDATASRGERRFSERLANELMDAAQNRGSSVKKKDDTHRMAEANKAFSHFKW